MTCAIELRSVGKRYWRLHEPAMLLKSLVPFGRPDKQEMWALSELSFSVAAGETVGILGRNGAGKTTLLRLLAGVSRPTVGEIGIRGRVAPLIGVGVGFHPEMTGLENVMVNGMLLGLSRAEVRARTDQIVAFSELGKFIDTPVKFYSSGMYMRLGFAVAAHVDPDVLLVDEVLAVGDWAFQLKCLDRMRELQRQGTSIVLVSHAMNVLQMLCPRAILIRGGQLEFDGDTTSAVARHHELLVPDAAEHYVDGPVVESPNGAWAGAVLVERSVLGPDGPTTSLPRGETVTYRLSLRLLEDIDSPQLFFNVVGDIGLPIYSVVTPLGVAWKSYRSGDQLTAEVSFDVRLGGGTYRLTAQVTDRNGRSLLYADEPGLPVYVPPEGGTGGYADLSGRITIDGEDRSAHRDPLMVIPGRRDQIPPSAQRPHTEK